MKAVFVSALGIATAASIEKQLPGPVYEKPAQVGPVAAIQEAPVVPKEAWGFVQKEYLIFNIVLSQLATEMVGAEFGPLAAAQDHIHYEIERLGVLMQTLSERADAFKALGFDTMAKKYIEDLTVPVIKMNSEIFSIAAPQCSWMASVAGAFEYMNDQFSHARSVYGASPTSFPEPVCNTRLAEVYADDKLSGPEFDAALSSVMAWHGKGVQSAHAAAQSSASASASSSAKSGSKSSSSASDAAFNAVPGLGSAFAAVLFALL